MNWIDGMNRALDYAEAHLTEPLTAEVLAKLAGCPSYHFQRIFTYIAGIPLSEYLRRRRMSRAVAALLGGDKVIDVALRYGYDSPTAFNRAFQSVHGVPPSQIQRADASLRSYPPLQFHLTVTGGETLEYRIEKRPAFSVTGLSAPLDRELESNFQAVPHLWNKVAAEGWIPQLMGCMTGEPQGLLGISACCGEEQWRYYIAVAGQGGPERCTIPAATWAIFPGAGAMPEAVQALERRVVTEWLPTSGYLYANAPDIEVYLNADPTNARFEVWLPVEPSA